MIVYLCKSCNAGRDWYCLNFEPGLHCELCGVELKPETFAPVNEERLAEIKAAASIPVRVVPK